MKYLAVCHYGDYTILEVTKSRLIDDYVQIDDYNTICVSDWVKNNVTLDLWARDEFRPEVIFEEKKLIHFLMSGKLKRLG